MITGAQKTVFVLEHNDDIRELFPLLLEEENYLVKSFECAASFASWMTGVAHSIHHLFHLNRS